MSLLGGGVQYLVICNEVLIILLPEGKLQQRRSSVAHTRAQRCP